MNLLQLSWKNIWSKPWSALLSIILFGLGVGLISMLLLINDQLDKQFDRNLADIDMIVGAKGSPLQLTLSSVYHSDNPTGNIPLKSTDFLKRLPLIKKTIPLSIGDAYRGYRIVGTEHSYPELYEMSLKEGKLWGKDFEATAGAKAAQLLELNIGDEIHSSHGTVQHDDQAFTITGTFKPCACVIDQLILTTVPSFWKLHASHQHEEEGEPETKEEDSHDGHDHDHDHDHDHEIAEEDKEITSMLVFARNELYPLELNRLINENSKIQSALPSMEMGEFAQRMETSTNLMKALASVIIFVSGLSIFIALFNSLRERKYELALLRVMGASPQKLFSLLIIEGLTLAFLGFIFGMLLSHIGMEVLARYMQKSWRYQFDSLFFLKEEIYLLGITLLIGFIAAFIPAIQAFRTEISKTLSKA